MWEFGGTTQQGGTGIGMCIMPNGIVVGIGQCIGSDLHEITIYGIADLLFDYFIFILLYNSFITCTMSICYVTVRLNVCRLYLLSLMVMHITLRVTHSVSCRLLL